MINNALRNEGCPLCGASKINKVGIIDYASPVLFSTHEITLSLKPEFWKCSACGSGFVQNTIPEKTAADLYKSGSGERWSEIPGRSKTVEVMSLLNDIYKKDLNVLDIGCNTGELLDLAQNKGCRTTGIEYCLNSATVLKQNGHAVFFALDEVKEHFDVINAFDLIEHIYDVPALLNACHDRLSPNGRLVLLTGDILSLSARVAGSNWWYLRYPEHIVFPSRQYFSLCGNFQVEKWITTYAAVGYSNFTLFTRLKAFLTGMVKGAYTGMPSLGPDHVLAVLKKR